jgi:cysteine desulfurase
MQPFVYLDHAATTPVRPEARDAMLPYLDEQAFGNPSSAHQAGRTSRAGLDRARRQVAQAIGAEPGQVFFTSGGTEADNLAVLGAALAARDGGRPMRAAVSAVEHKAVLAAAHAVAHLGGSEESIAVDRNGVVDLNHLDQVLTRRPAVVSVMWVNNETGVIQPIAEIGRRCRAAGVLFHTDAVQAFGNLPLRLGEILCDLLSLSAHKIGGPKGVGALMVRSRDMVHPVIQGGSQQAGIRPGTENISGAVAFGCAAELAAREQPEHGRHLAGLRNELRDRLRTAVLDLVVVGESAERVPHILNVCVPGTDSETLLVHLDQAGIAASSGSACTTGAVEPSHVLVAMGIPRDLAISAVRFSLGRTTTKADIDRVVEEFPRVVARVRSAAGASSHG